MENETVVISEEQQKMKRCSKCKIEKPATKEYFSMSKRYKSGLQSWCRECRRVYAIQRYRDPEIHRKTLDYLAKRTLDFVSGKLQHSNNVITKICPKCGIEKPATMEFFGVCNRNKSGLTGKCRECLCAYQAKLRLDPEHREKQRVYNEIYFKTKQGKSVLGTNTHRRRSKNLILPSTFTVEEWQQCLSYWENKCAYCGSSDRITMDHFIPLVSRIELCPGTIKENIVPACKHCNSSKHNKSPYVWASQEALDRIETYFASLVLHGNI